MFYYLKDQILNIATEIFENLVIKVDGDNISAENDKEITRRKATIAEIV